MKERMYLFITASVMSVILSWAYEEVMGITVNAEVIETPMMSSPELPKASIDLTTDDGVKLVQGQWRYSDTRIIEVDFRKPGADQQPTGSLVRTYDYEPHAGGADFDDSGWERIGATSLDQRRGTGRICFNWYRIKLTIPNRIGTYDPTGSTVVFETALDDYAEVWVDGELPRYVGQKGGSVAAGWNAPNRILVGKDVRPGQQIQIAVFGINGPISNPPFQLHLDALCPSRVLQNSNAGPDSHHPERSQR